MLIHRCAKLTSASSVSVMRNLSNKTCIFTKPRRVYYLRQYPTIIVQPDGSTYNARYDEPRGVIKLPLDLSKLSEKERLTILENRRPKKKIHYQKEETIEFDPAIYLKYINKK